jgi:hypothetical protein
MRTSPGTGHSGNDNLQIAGGGLARAGTYMPQPTLKQHPQSELDDARELRQASD